MDGFAWLKENLSAYSHLHREQPLTLAVALQDSPTSPLAWMSQVFREDVNRDFVPTNASIYWLTGTVAFSARLYYESARMPRITEPATVPVGLTVFGNDFRSLRTLAQRAHRNIVHWSEFEHGGHWAAYHAPDVVVGEVARFFGAIR